MISGLFAAERREREGGKLSYVSYPHHSLKTDTD